MRNIVGSLVIVGTTCVGCATIPSQPPVEPTTDAGATNAEKAGEPATPAEPTTPAEPPAAEVVANEQTATATGLDTSVMLHMVRARINEQRGCYRAALEADPNLAGTATVTWAIDAEGVGHSAAVEPGALGTPELHACLADAVNGDKFPTPLSGEASMTVEFVFSSGD
jgi:hypothetical protein